MIDAANWLFLLLQIFFVDLLLGAGQGNRHRLGVPATAARGHGSGDSPSVSGSLIDATCDPAFIEQPQGLGLSG